LEGGLTLFSYFLFTFFLPFGFVFYTAHVLLHIPSNSGSVVTTKNDCQVITRQAQGSATRSHYPGLSRSSIEVLNPRITEDPNTDTSTDPDADADEPQPTINSLHSFRVRSNRSIANKEINSPCPYSDTRLEITTGIVDRHAVPDGHCFCHSERKHIGHHSNTAECERR